MGQRLFFGGVAVVFSIMLFTALKSGKFTIYGFPISRKDASVAFWFNAGIVSFAIVVSLTIALFFDASSGTH